MGKSIYDLREMLCEELENMTEQRSLSPDKLKLIDMLTHSIKSIDTIIAMEDAGYSRDYHGGSYYRDQYRDRRGRYSRDEHLTHKLEEMLHESTSEEERKMLKHFIDQMK